MNVLLSLLLIHEFFFFVLILSLMVYFVGNILLALQPMIIICSIL